jgi:chloramphenicol 3-O phosphotransferase
MKKIIFLNGCSSSGKTSIAKALQQLSSEPLLHMGTDWIGSTLPEKFCDMGDKSKEGFYYFEESKNSRGKIVSVKRGILGEKFFNKAAEAIKVISESNVKIILDEVLVNQDGINSYLKWFTREEILFVKIFADYDVLIKREQDRGDRIIGFVNGQFDLVHNFIDDYDLEIDTGEISPNESAKKILDNFF